MSRQHNFIREILASSDTEQEQYTKLLRYRKSDLLEVLMDLHKATHLAQESKKKI